MKYVAIIDTLDELSKEAIENIKKTVFVGNEDASYCFDFDSIKEVPEMMKAELRDDVRVKDIKSGYNQALWDCGVR